MTRFDHLRLWFDGLDEDLQHAIGFALVPVLVDDLRAQRTRSERDFKALGGAADPIPVHPACHWQGGERHSFRRLRLRRGSLNGWNSALHRISTCTGQASRPH